MGTVFAVFMMVANSVRRGDVLTSISCASSTLLIFHLVDSCVESPLRFGDNCR